MSKKVFCFGELLLRYSPPQNGEWIRNACMPAYLGGSELNVATALACWQQPVKYFTALPGHFLSSQIIQDIQNKNIDASSIRKSGSRIGTYYISQGADLKSSEVIYDRAGSSFSELTTGQIAWQELLADCGWFHFSAINPGLNENMAAVCLEALNVAKEMGLTISVDLNYRSKLWNYGKAPQEIMPQLVHYADVVVGNIWSVESLLNIKSEIKSSEGKNYQELMAAAHQTILEFAQNYPSIETLALTFRMEDNYWAGLKAGKEMFISSIFETDRVVDRSGSGDCFMAGVIYGRRNNLSAQEILNFATAAAVGKLYESGDTTAQSIQSVHSRMNIKK